MNSKEVLPAGVDLAAHLSELQARLAEAEETLQAIRCGAIDSLVISGREGDRVFTLESAETPYRLLVEESNEGALLLLQDGTILFANARFAQMAHTSLEQVIGCHWWQFFPPADHTRLEKLVRATRTGGGCRGEFHLPTLDGAARPVQVSLSLLRNTLPETLSAIVTDLTERELAQTALRRANEELEVRVQQRTAELSHANDLLRTEIEERKQAEAALQEAQSELTAHAHHLEDAVQERTAKLQASVDDLHHVSYAMVHDMRAPLRALQGFAELLEAKRCDWTQPQSHEFIRRIIVAAKRLDELVTDGLKYTKILHHETQLRPIDLAKLINELIQTYPNLLPDKADIRIQGELPIVLGSQSFLTQCFSNLLGNAVKFVPAGSRPQIRIWAERVGAAGDDGHLLTGRQGGSVEAGGKASAGKSRASLALNHCTAPSVLDFAAASSFVRVWVADNGIGIPAGAQPRLFGMFQKLNKDYEGTGIGLAIVRKVVDRMGGRVGVESEEGKGSRFWVELRLTEPIRPDNPV